MFVIWPAQRADACLEFLCPLSISHARTRAVCVCLACPFREPIVMYRTLAVFAWYEMINWCDSVSVFMRLLKMFLSEDFIFEKRIGFHGPPLYPIYIITFTIIGKGVSGQATDSSCGIWGRGWTTCPLCDSPLYIHVSKRQLVCEFEMV